ncbi:MAG: hypothetical protein CVV05_13035 [Gammaproteobacteria bacterium HGW-Gammaproteobacteria-1]|jgi:hemerythrin|nr:MAG: hypothetical protein CVV05_13035 [Gammaproteobacteria bacterium HGW-Gammaproteobacteria-1]
MEALLGKRKCETEVASLDLEHSALIDTFYELAGMFTSLPGVAEVEHSTDLVVEKLDRLLSMAQDVFMREEFLLREVQHPRLPEYLRDRVMQLAELRLEIKSIKDNPTMLNNSWIKRLEQSLLEMHSHSKQMFAVGAS